MFYCFFDNFSQKFNLQHKNYDNVNSVIDCFVYDIKIVSILHFNFTTFINVFL